MSKRETAGDREMTDITPELIAQAADVLDSRRHRYEVDCDTWKPYCICDWSSEEPYDVAAYDRHLAVAVLEAVAPLIAAQALGVAADELEDAADEVDSLYFGPDQHTPFTRGAALLWGAKQAAKRVRERAAELRSAS